jgi:hypothetical protein
MFSLRAGRSLRTAAVLVLAGLCCGCGGPATVSGTVKYRGQAVTQGQISFIGADGKSASGTINPDGTYSVPNVPSGPVTVVVLAYRVEGDTKTDPLAARTEQTRRMGRVDSAIPTKYNEPGTSGLKYKIESRSQTIDIDLTD